MHLIFRILGLDMPELSRAEEAVRRLARHYGFDAEVSKVNEVLELGRMGVLDALPALEINGIIVSKGAPLTEEMVSSILKRLAVFSSEGTAAK